MRKCKEWIKNKINERKKKKYLKSVGRNATYSNKPISEENVDEIGMNTYVDYLESAIENNADMISVISSFGTGKSSLIELLKEKYNGWEKKNKQRCKRVYCQVNLWSQLEETNIDKSEEKMGEHTLELHRTFLYQLVSTIYPYKGSYISRRTGRNFGMFKISAETPMWNLFIHVAVIIFAIVSLTRHFSEQIINSDLLSKKTLNFLIIVGYVFSAIVVLLLLLRTEIIFSSQNSEGNRKIEENELIDLFRQHVLISKNWFNCIVSKLLGKRHLIVVIEDLDRTQDADSVYHFLKELRKYYVPNDQIEKNFINKVTFIINIMPEESLYKKISDDKEKEEHLYDKIFDYSIHLNKVNIDNFDAILDALLNEKKDEFKRLGIELRNIDNVHEIPGMPWIVYGKELSIRQVKTRLNDAILLYESLKQKFGEEYADFEKCACVAYLRSTFSRYFYELPDRKLEEMVLWYAKEHGTEKEFMDEFMNERTEKEFLSTLYQLIGSHLIDGNYRIYFYNYPKGSKLYNVQETRVRNLIMYNEELTGESEAEILMVAQNHPSVITEALTMAIDLVKQLPEAVLFSKGLWGMAINHFWDDLNKLLKNKFEFIEELHEEHYEIINSVIKFEQGPRLLGAAILVNEAEIISKLRTFIVKNHLNYISHFIDLFRLPDLPLDKEELDEMKEVSLNHILDMVKGSVGELDGEVLDEICVRILSEKDKEIQKRAYTFYEELLDKLETKSIIEDLVNYVKLRNELPEKIEDVIYEGINEDEIESKYYFEAIKSISLDDISTKQLERISQLDLPGHITEEISQKMKEHGFLMEYLLNMLVIDSNKISLEWSDVELVMKEKGNKVWEKYPKVFVELRKWGCEKFKDEMKNLEEFFKEPYPMITMEEASSISLIDTMLQLYDVKRAAEDDENIFVDFCNRQFRKSEVAYAIFLFVAQMDKDTIPKVFYSLDMRRVRFSLMASAKKERVVEKLRMPLKLTTSKEIVRFMEFTESLVPELEKEIILDLKEKGNDELCRAYIRTAQKYGKITRETIKNICAMPTIYPYGEMINEELYKKKYYKKYVCSITQEKGLFVIEYEKLENLWEAYLGIFKSSSLYGFTRSLMYKNEEFLKIIQNRQLYKELPEESQMAIASIPQDEGTLINILSYSDDFVVKYFSHIAGFTSKNAANTFINIMETHQKYAQRKEIYDNVYPKLENPQLKGRYTKIYNRANS